MYKHASKYMNVVTVDVAHRSEHIVFPFSLVVLVKPRAWSIYRQLFCHWGASPDPEHILAGCSDTGMISLLFSALEVKKKCCVPTHSLCLRQLIFSVGDWIYSLDSLGEYYKLSYGPFPLLPLQILWQAPHWVSQLDLNLPWTGNTHAQPPVSLGLQGDCVGLFQFVHHCSVQCYDVAKNKTVAASWM